MTEEDEILDDIAKRLMAIESKLNLIARAIGGPMMRREWTKLEEAAGVEPSKLTFKSITTEVKP